MNSNLRASLCGSLLVAGLTLAWSLPAGASQAKCNIVDLMPDFWRVADASEHESAAQQIAEFRRTLVAPHPDLFGKDGLGFKSAAALDAAIPSSLARALQQANSIASTERLLQQQLPAQLHKFQKVFPDFQCDFTIYLVPSLGQLDGAGRLVGGKPALLLGVDRVAATHTARDLPIFLDHELFHRYHYEVAGFSDDKAQQEVLWKTLWAEGLATYVSMELNPPASMQDALFLPKDLVKRSQPVLASVIAELLPQLDQVNPELFAKFFLYHGSNSTPPSRVGYYVGALAAARMAQKHSLNELAHMPADAVRAEIGRVLAELEQ